MKCLAQGHDKLMLGFEPSTSVSRNRHFNMTNMLQSVHLDNSGNESDGEIFLYCLTNVISFDLLFENNK